MCVEKPKITFLSKSIEFGQYFHLGLRSILLDSTHIGSYQKSRHVNELYDADIPSLNIEGKENGQLPPENYTVSGTTSLPTQAELNLDAGRLFT